MNNYLFGFIARKVLHRGKIPHICWLQILKCGKLGREICEGLVLEYFHNQDSLLFIDW